MNKQAHTNVGLLQKSSWVPLTWSGTLQRKCACGGTNSLAGGCNDCKKKTQLQRKAVADQEGRHSVPPIVNEVLRSPGQPLSDETRAFFETRLGHDFSRVRVHTGTTAADSARAVNAHAYTVGQDIVFDTGQYAPNMAPGRQLLAHELAHVVQQPSGPAADTQSNHSLSLGHPSDEFEREADQVARQVVSEHQPVLVAPHALKAVGRTYVQRDLALKPPEPGAKANLTPAEIQAAIRFNQKELQDKKKLDLVCDIVGVPVQVCAINERFVQTVAIYQAQFRLPVTGQVDEQTWSLLNKEVLQEKKETALWKHTEQQKKVIKLVESIRKIPRDPSKGTSDPDTLLLNSVEWLDANLIKLFVMTPTHDHDTRRSREFAYFDTRVKHPDIGGDYQTAPPPPGGADPGVEYTRDQKVGGSAFFDTIQLFTSTEEISEDEFRRNFVHEVQHVADQVGGRKAMSIGVKSDLEQAIDSYQTEFRGYWVQPALPTGSKPFLHPYENFGSSQKPATNPGPVYANPADRCKNFCVSPAGNREPSQCKNTCNVDNSGMTNFKNEKQQEIFYYLLENYKNDRFDCFYICVPEFRKMAHDFSQPTGENLVNSVRIEELIKALNRCDPSMSISDYEVQDVMAAAKNLDQVDRLFLKEVKKATPSGAKQPPAKDIKSSQPFWDHAGRKLPKAALAMLEKAI